MRRKIFSVLFIFLFFFTIGFQAAAQRTGRRTCDWCSRLIPYSASYLESGEMVFCKEACWEAFKESQMPVCSVCGKRFSSGYTGDGKAYCSDSCLRSTYQECSNCHRREPSGVIIGNKYFLCSYCSKLPRCFCCQTPLDLFAVTWEDGRKICRVCDRDGIREDEEAVKVMNNVRQALKDRFGLSTDHTIQFKLCNSDDIRKERGTDGVQELGLFIFGRTSVTLFGKGIIHRDRYSIMVLRGLPPDYFRSVSAHELAHDWMREHFPYIDQPEVTEGFAQFVSWSLAKKEKLDRISWGIEQNIDPVYGDGFRKIHKLLSNTMNSSEWESILQKTYPASTKQEKKVKK